GLARGVHAAGHEVHILAFATDAQRLAAQPALDTYCASASAITIEPPRRAIRDRLRDLAFSSAADMQRRFYSPLYEARLRDLLAHERFDLIQIESLEMAAYLPAIRAAQPDTPVIYDSFNAEFELQHSIYDAEKGSLKRLPGWLYSRIQWQRLIRFEGEVCRAATHVIAVSDEDADAFHRLLPGCNVTVIPNGIDAAAYARVASPLDLGEHALLFTGSMSYRPNVDAVLWFADHVLDEIRAAVPDARLFIVGSNPHPRLDILRERDDVEITGWVPDVNPFLHAAAVTVVPLRMGSGTRLKLLQAMAAGQAIVSTCLGAAGLDVRDGRELRLADRADDFANAVITLLRDPALRCSLGEAGTAYVQSHHDWSIIVPDLLALYKRIVAR
uniref:glycosyltransferase n=1 Tax=Aggregatilinea sp. TaxID=2806333 RepID=UPI002C5D9026